jgi:hypothetical protein
MQSNPASFSAEAASSTAFGKTETYKEDWLDAFFDKLK